MFNKEYIYIRQVNQSSVHIGRTIAPNNRYELQADQTIEDFKEYLHIFECEAGKGSEIEANVKKEFKNEIVDNTPKKEQYLWNNAKEKSYLNFLKNHKYIIRQLAEDEVLKYNKNKQNIKIVVKEKKCYKGRDLKKLGLNHKNILEKSKKMAMSIQKNNDITKYTEHDEYFTRYEDIETMIGEPQIAKQFNGKVVFCNCDDPLGIPDKHNDNIADYDEKNCSAFALYFKKNFKKLGLKKLICLHYAGLSDIFNIGETIGMIYTFDGKPPVKIKREVGFDGSFYDKKSIDILNNEADIVCTNHPWSLTPQYYKILFASGKKFLVISNSGIVLIPSFFNYVKEHKIKAIKRCENFLKGSTRLPARATGAWMTNLEYKRKPYKKLIPLKQIPKNEIEIDDNGILNFNNGYIPSDYDKEFAISSAPIIGGILEFGFEVIKAPNKKTYTPYIKGEKKYDRLLIKKSTQKSK